MILPGMETVDDCSNRQVFHQPHVDCMIWMLSRLRCNVNHYTDPIDEVVHWMFLEMEVLAISSCQ